MSDLDAKTDLLVWLLENRCGTIHCREVMVGEASSRTEVTFEGERGRMDSSNHVVLDWAAWSRLRRSEYDTIPGFQFSPSYSGLVRVTDSRAEKVVKNRRENGALLKRRAELEADLAEVNGELGEGGDHE